MEKFNFGNFLLNNGFSFTNDGCSRYYHILKKGTEHRFKITGLDFEHTQPAHKDFKKTMKVPLAKTTALKIIKELKP